MGQMEVLEPQELLVQAEPPVQMVLMAQMELQVQLVLLVLQVQMV